MTTPITFITGNEHKAAQLSRYLDYPIQRHDLDLIEVQSVDPREVVIHKAKEAYSQLKKTVLIEDTSLAFCAMGKLPGPFIKWFLKELGNEGMCRMLDAFSDRSAICTVSFALYDGTDMNIFDATAKGEIAPSPRGNDGFGWNPIFIHEGYSKTRAEMSQEESDKINPRRLAALKLHKYLQTHS